MNSIKTVLLLGALTGLLLWAGEIFGGRSGLMLALVIAAGLNMASWYFSDKIALAAHRAQPVTEAEAPGLYSVVAELTQNAGLPMPRLYIIPEMQPNAFATGRGPHHAAVAVTQGLLAHELGHVKHRDILISSIAATLAGAVTFIARMAGWALMFGGGRDERNGGALGGLLFYLMAPIAALLIQLAVSRSREFAADAEGARIAGTPLGLASALRKLGAYTARVPMRTARPNTPHPPIEERIRRLEAMARG